MDDTVTIHRRILRLQEVYHVSEIKLYLSDRETHRRKPTDRFDCWPHAWVGGQALARYVLDNPDIVAGKTVVDLASGSGIVAIAAKLAGASKVIAMDDYDPCIECIKLNAKANNVDIEIQKHDIFTYSPNNVDLFLMGDPFLNVDLFPYLKSSFNRVLIGCPNRMSHYSSYMKNTVKTYHLDIKFDGEPEYDVNIWWLNE